MSSSLFLSPLVTRALMPGDQPVGEAQQWILTAALGYRSELFGEIVVPAGYVTDYASIPQIFENYIDDDDPGILYPSVIHDWLYTHAGQLPDGRAFSRELADKILVEAMTLCGARLDQRVVVFQLVRWFGGSHWKP